MRSLCDRHPMTAVSRRRPALPVQQRLTSAGSRWRRRSRVSLCGYRTTLWHTVPDVIRNSGWFDASTTAGQPATAAVLISRNCTHSPQRSWSFQPSQSTNRVFDFDRLAWLCKTVFLTQLLGNYKILNIEIWHPYKNNTANIFLPYFYCPSIVAFTYKSERRYPRDIKLKGNLYSAWIQMHLVCFVVIYRFVLLWLCLSVPVQMITTGLLHNHWAGFDQPANEPWWLCAPNDPVGHSKCQSNTLLQLEHSIQNKMAINRDNSFILSMIVTLFIVDKRILE